MVEDDKNHLEDHEEWKRRDEDEEVDPRESFRQASHIAVCMAYDLVDKLRFWEKETLKLSEADIEERLPHMAEFMDKLRDAYLHFAEVDL